ncbi:uncharacterized protein LOC105833431 isoform X2 [Monomorium pharaonis]|uniref:uncharacterized protein LOC105833431 isoform X2 n=1 Tax=Monomorium pharaonis TaxID=307658 RepID=UPI00102E2053|nr:uncharacterized protein LOC105833431 isoform X2 [Monomorium pharaonis]
MGRAKTPKEIQVETWVIRDKISRYRGILKLDARDKKLQLSQATKLKSIVSRKIASLKINVKRHREIVNDLQDDDKQHVLRLLGDHRRFYLAFNRLTPPEIYTAIYQDCNLKRRLLDKLYYEKKRKLKRGIELQLEHNVLSTELEEQSEYLPNCEQQRLIAQLQRSIAKHNTAKDIRSTYCSILNILKKDAIFFDTLLNILKEDQVSQCKAMLRVTVMGQLAAENLDDIKQKYKRMSRVVWRNMKIREQMLSNVHYQVKDLWAYAQSLVRVESVHIFAKRDVDVTDNKILEKQLAHLEDICIKVKEGLLVRSYHDLLSSYKINGMQDVLEQIEIEKKREKDLKEQISAHGKLLTNLKSALQNMNMMLLRFIVKHNGKAVVKKLNKGDKKEPIINGREDMNERDALAEIEGVDTDVLGLLSKISRKVSILFGISNFDLKQEDEARDLYYTYVSQYNSDLTFGTGEEEPIGLLVEHEIIDVSVPTRTDIKYHSRQILEAHLKPE